MSFIMPTFTHAFPEIALLVVGCVALLVDVFVTQSKERYVTYAFVQAGLLLAAGLAFMHWGEPKAFTFNNMFVCDPLAILLKIVVYLSSAGVLWYSRRYVSDFKMPAGEYYLLLLFSVLGMSVLISGSHFLTLFLGLELFSLPVYAMVALRRDDAKSSEAAVKYFIIGAMASGMLLYGLSMLYGATKSLSIAGVASSIAAAAPSLDLVLVFGLVFTVAGLAFKLGMVPFHMWVPDVYEGSPNSVTMFISTAPKVAGLALILRLLVEAMPSLQPQWQQMFIVLAVLSMALGNLTAIVQTNLKRMLAYSSIAHMGYMSLGLIAGTKAGYAGSTFYMITYTLMALGAFGLLTMLSHSGVELENIDDFRGLNHRNPWLAFVMLILMFSMAGIPPLVGFMAKLAVLQALIASHFVWLAALALLLAVIGAYYYIRVVKVMYFEEPDAHHRLTCSADLNVALTVNGLGVLALGIFPGALLHICHQVFAV